MQAPGRVVTLPPRGEVFADVRGAGRVLRASWHLEADVVVLSVWRDGGCVATVRLDPPDAARLVAVLAEGVAAATARAGDARAG